MAVHGAAKWQAAVRMAAAMSYALLDLGHRAGLLAFGARVLAECPRGRGRHHYAAIARLLAALQPARAGERSELGVCAQHLHGAASVFAISDFLADDEMCGDLCALLQRCTALHALQVTDSAETELREAGEFDLVDVETGDANADAGRRGRECAGDRRTRRDDGPVARFLRPQRHCVYRLGCRTPVAAHAASTSGPGTIDLLSFAAPIWLSGLLLLPVIRWLHRGGRQRRAVPVSRLDLWQRSVASSPAAGERRPPDPAWRRRALLTALLFIALSEPQLPEQRTRITLWVDDSLSMLTREAQRQRGSPKDWRKLARCWPRFRSADVEVRTLE